MKSIARQGTRWLLLIVLAFSLITGSGCGPKPISRGTLDYFYGLVNKQYWQHQANGLALNDEFGTEQLVLAQQGTSDKEQYMIFGDVAVTSSSQKSGPTDGVIKIKVFDGATEKEVRARIDDTNRATLEKMLAETFESKAQRDQRLKGDAYVAKLKEADTLLAANKVADAIAAFKAAQTMNDTDEIKTRLDGIYLKQGKYYYGQKKYDVALSQLRLVSFDPVSLKEAQELLPAVQAAADKAAADKAAADKAAADKAAADKAADAQRKTWFLTLTDYYQSNEDAITAMWQKGGSYYTAQSALAERIKAYCRSTTGMKPTELDQMRTELYALVLTEAKWISENLKVTPDNAAIEPLAAERTRHIKEFRRLRDIVASRYAYWSLITP